jgi:hypothetical protein
MKAKIIGFKTGKARPVFNRTVDVELVKTYSLGQTLYFALLKSDYISVRRLET